MRPSFFFEPKVELQQQPSDNPAEENGDPEPRSGEEQELVEQSDGREGLRGRLARVKFVASSARKGKHLMCFPSCAGL